jgi:hypothetical protein
MNKTRKSYDVDKKSGGGVFVVVAAQWWRIRKSDDFLLWTTKPAAGDRYTGPHCIMTVVDNAKESVTA